LTSTSDEGVVVLAESELLETGDAQPTIDDNTMDPTIDLNITALLGGAAGERVHHSNLPTRNSQLETRNYG
jgi:hypothetical protein